MLIDIDQLKQKVLQTLAKNLNDQDAAVVAKCLLWAEMSGYVTQGIIKLTGTEPLQDIEPDGQILIEKDTRLSQVINANRNPSMLASQKGTEAAIQKAKAHGFGLVAVHNFFSSNGALSYYTEQIAKADLIGLMVSRSPGATTAFDSIDPLFGTNPISFSFPTTEEPFVFDMATSAMTFYGLILAKIKGEKLPENFAIDKNGHPTLDPEAAMSGALLPFDRSFKGSSLSLMVEVLAGPLANSAFCDYQTFDQEWGCTIIAIDPELLTDINSFKQKCTELIATIKKSRKREGVTTIRLPGERARTARQAALASNRVTIDDKLLNQLGYSK